MCHTGDSEGCPRLSDDRCLSQSPCQCQHTPSANHPVARGRYDMRGDEIIM